MLSQTNSLLCYLNLWCGAIKKKLWLTLGERAATRTTNLVLALVQNTTHIRAMKPTQPKFRVRFSRYSKTQDMFLFDVEKKAMIDWRLIEYDLPEAKANELVGILTKQDAEQNT